MLIVRSSASGAREPVHRDQVARRSYTRRCLAEGGGMPSVASFEALSESQRLDALLTPWGDEPISPTRTPSRANASGLGPPPEE